MIQAASLTNSRLEDLGFDRSKYPAEKTIFWMFKETGINVEKTTVSGNWLTRLKSKYQFAKVWQGIDGFLKAALVHKN